MSAHELWMLAGAVVLLVAVVVVTSRLVDAYVDHLRREDPEQRAYRRMVEALEREVDR